MFFRLCSLQKLQPKASRGAALAPSAVPFGLAPSLQVGIASSLSNPRFSHAWPQLYQAHYPPQAVRHLLTPSGKAPTVTEHDRG